MIHAAFHLFNPVSYQPDQAAGFAQIIKANIDAAVMFRWEIVEMPKSLFRVEVVSVMFNNVAVLRLQHGSLLAYFHCGARKYRLTLLGV